MSHLEVALLLYSSIFVFFLLAKAFIPVLERRMAPLKIYFDKACGAIAIGIGLSIALLFVGITGLLGTFGRLFPWILFAHFFDHSKK